MEALASSGYQTYRKSEVVGIDAIPSHWNTRALWTLSTERKTKGAANRTLLSVFLDRGVILYEEGGGQVHAPSEDLSNYQEVCVGDFVLNNQQAWRGSVGVSGYDGIISPAYVVRQLDREQLNFDYAGYLFRTSFMATQYFMASKGVGTIQRQLDRRLLKWVQVVLPPLDEQARIAAFLDAKTAEIDAAIAKKARLIQLIHEQKAILINRAVTRGLNPAVPLRDSGVPWIGEVPAHWEVKRNKQLFVERKDTVGKQSSEYTLLSLTLRGVIPRDMTNPQGKFPAEFDSYKVVHPDDLVFCLFDIEETPRTVGIAEQFGMITGAYTIVACNESISAKYLYYFYLALDNEKRLKPLYTGLRNVVQISTFFGMKSPVPPPEEQEHIVEFLDQIIKDIDSLVAKTNKSIDLLNECRSILIAEAVTGKIKVS